MTPPGTVPAVEDFLYAQQSALKTIGYVAETMLGYGPAVYGCVCYPTTPASMQIYIGRGVVTSLLEVDAAGYGVLPPDNSPLLKLALNPASVLFPVGGTFSAPIGAGTSVAYLIQAAVSETDTAPRVLSYYNAANPAQAYAGPNNSGAAQDTRRVQTINFAVKAGAPATSGAQQAPAPDAGFIPLYVLTIPSGATAITQAMIAIHPSSPAVQFTLPQLVPGFYRVATFTTPGVFPWTVPVGVQRVKATGIGGGGGGSNCKSTGPGTSQSGGGGGAGALCQSIVPVTPGQVLLITVGAGGNPQQPGGATTLGTQANPAQFFSAGGGAGASFITATTSPGAIGGTAAGGNVLNANGGAGGDGQSGGFIWPGNGGSGPLGGASRAGNQAGGTALGPGGGGGGAYDSAGTGNQYPGGAGANGLMTVEF